jgi:hypothetical protein
MTYYTSNQEQPVRANNGCARSSFLRRQKPSWALQINGPLQTRCKAIQKIK